MQGYFPSRTGIICHRKTHLSGACLEEAAVKPFLNEPNMRLLSLALTYGLYLSCMSIVTWGGYCHFLFGFIEERLFLYEHFTRELALAFCLISAGISAYLQPEEHRLRQPIVALAFFIMGGMLVLVQQFAITDDPSQTFFAQFSLILAGFCFGWASGIICCSLQEVLSSLNLYEAGFVVFGAAGFSAVPYFLLDIIPATPLKQIIYFFIVIPTMAALVHFLCENRTKHNLRLDLKFSPKPTFEQASNAIAETWKPLLCICASAFVVGIFRAQATANPQAMLVSNNTYMLAMAIASIVLLVSWSQVYRRLHLSKLHTFLFPITATAFLALPLLSKSLQELAMFIAFWSYAIMSCLLIVSSIRTTRVYSLHPVLVYGLLYGIVTIASVAGSVVGMLYRYIGVASSGDLAFVALVAIYLLSLTMNIHRTQEPKVKPHEDAHMSKRVDTVLTALTGPSHETTLAETQQREDFEARCAYIIEHYKLSRREADVMSLLVRGRDVPYIAEELVISKNTVRTHKKNIFSKTGVHSSQELIDLVDE